MIIDITRVELTPTKIGVSYAILTRRKDGLVIPCGQGELAFPTTDRLGEEAATLIRLIQARLDETFEASGDLEVPNEPESEEL